METLRKNLQHSTKGKTKKNLTLGTDYNEAPLHYSVFFALHIHSRFINSHLGHSLSAFRQTSVNPLLKEVNTASAQL